MQAEEEGTEFGKGQVTFGPVLSQLTGCSASLQLRHKLFPLSQMSTCGTTISVQDHSAQFASPWHFNVP